MALGAGSIARRYARALFAIGADKAQFEAFGSEVSSLAALFTGSAELRQALENPVFQMSQRRRVLERLLPQVAPSPDVQKFALLLLERRRITLLPRIAEAFSRLTDERLGRLRATITSPKALDAGTVASVTRALESRTGKKILAETRIDPGLIGGIVAQVGDLIFDGSLRARLDALRARVLQ